MGLLNKTPPFRPTRYNSVRTNVSELGTPLPIIFGQQRVGAKLLWYGDFKSAKAQTPGGSGLGKGGENYVYSTSLIAALCQGPCLGLLNLWQGANKYVGDFYTENFTVPSGGGSYTVANATAFMLDHGAAQQYTFSYVTNDYGSPTVATGFVLEDSGGFLWTIRSDDATGGLVAVKGSTGTAAAVYLTDPTGATSWQIEITTAGSLETVSVTLNASYPKFLQTSAEFALQVSATGNLQTFPQTVVSSTITGTDARALVAVPSAPGAGQYSVDPSTGVYTFGAALATVTIEISYSAFRYQLVADELSVVPLTSPYQVTIENQPYFQTDEGVVYYPSDVALTPVGGTPSVTGTYNPNGGNYLFAPGDAGKGIEISYQYKDPNVDVNAPSSLNLTFFGGTLGQSPWSYLESNYPGQALGYRMICYIASEAFYLGFSPMMPSLNYEVAGLLAVGGGVRDANPADCIYGLLTDPGYGIGFPAASIDDASLRGTGTSFGTSSPSMKAMCAANEFFISDVLDNQMSCASVIGRWLEASQTGAYWSEGLLKFKPYYGSSAVGNGWFYAPPTQPVVSLDDSDFVQDKDSDPIKVTRRAWQDAYNRVQLSWDVRANDYNPDVLYAQDDASIQRFGLRIEDPTDYTFLVEEDAAQFAANMRVQRNTQIRNTYQFTLQESYCYLEPMDVVEITDETLGLVSAPVRLTSVEYQADGFVVCEAEDFPWAVLNVVLYPKQAQEPTGGPSSTVNDPGNTTLTILEGPNRLNKQLGYILYVGAAGQNKNWGGCQLWISLDGTIYSPLYKFQNASRIGKLTAALAATADPDTTDTLSVQMINSDAGLISVPQSVADLFGTLSAIITGSGVELISYENAALAGINTYNLTYLRRGVYGSAVAAHSIGDEFMRMDDGVFQYQYDPTLVGTTVYIKATSFNTLGQNEQSLADVTALEFALEGISVGAIDILAGQPNTVLSQSLTSLLSSSNSHIGYVDQTIPPGATGTWWFLSLYAVVRTAGTAGLVYLTLDYWSGGVHFPGAEYDSLDPTVAGNSVQQYINITDADAGKPIAAFLTWSGSPPSDAVIDFYVTITRRVWVN